MVAGTLSRARALFVGWRTEKAQIGRRPLHAGFAPPNAPLRSNSARDTLSKVGCLVLGFRSTPRSAVLHQHSTSIGCGHFIKSPHIICRLAHRQSAERLEADTRGARGPLASPALPLVNWGAGIAPLAPLHRAGLWRCLRRMRAFICLRAVVAVPLSSVCLSSSGRLGVLFGFVLLPRAYSRGLRPHPLPLSGSCRARMRAARGHAAIAALRHRGWYIFCRLPRCAAAAPPRGFPPVQLPGVCPRGGASDCPTDSDLIYRLPHRKFTI